VSAEFHVDLRGIARFLPRGVGRPALVRVLRALERLAPSRSRIGETTIETVPVPGPADAPPVPVRLYRPPGVVPGGPALLWIHGGGFVMGRAANDDETCAEIARALGILVVSVDYRLAPEHPFPAPLEDCHAALAWLFRDADRLGVDAARIAIGGESAGGGLAAQLALLAHDRGVLRPVFQLLVYPMLDDRTVLRTDLDGTMHRLWDHRSNAWGWASYLGTAPGGADVSALAAPARRADLVGLPPAWIGVGTHDLFHDEDVAYAHRLREAGVPCGLEIVDGAFHGFNRVAGSAPVTRRFRAAMVGALREALFWDGSGHSTGSDVDV
jgi:acetyl esterase/lipase